MTTHHLTRFSGNNEWYTPARYIELARKVLGTIDLDPASNDIAQQTVRASRYYTIADDGLEQQWRGNVWLNPPYSRDLISRFVVKLVEHVEAGNVSEAIMLTHAATDTGWFHKAAGTATAICFTRGRISFTSAAGTPLGKTPQGQSFFHFGPNASQFVEAFSDVGLVVCKSSA